MALNVSAGQNELARVAAEAYEGKTLKVMLCSIGSTELTANSLLSSWQAIEKSGNGYVRYSSIIETGSYSETDAAYIIPSIDAEFSSTGAGYIYDRIVLYIDGATYPYSVIEENPNIALSSGQYINYRLTLKQSS